VTEYPLEIQWKKILRCGLLCSQRVSKELEGSGVVVLTVNDKITITDDGISALGKRFPHPLGVEINGCEMVTGASIIALCARCSVLQIINLARCDCVVDDIIALIIRIINH
jgi:hypothetical protein